MPSAHHLGALPLVLLRHRGSCASLAVCFKARAPEIYFMGPARAAGFACPQRDCPNEQFVRLYQISSRRMSCGSSCAKRISMHFRTIHLQIDGYAHGGVVRARLSRQVREFQEPAKEKDSSVGNNLLSGRGMCQFMLNPRE